MSLGRKFVFAMLLCVLGLATMSGLSQAAPPAAKPCDPTKQCCLPDDTGDLTPPILSCSSGPGLTTINLQVCGAGTYGALAGFSIHMMTKAEWDANGGAFDSADPSYRCFSFGGNAAGGTWSLSKDECVTIVFGPNFTIDYPNGSNGVSYSCGIPVLLCGTEYVFEVFAHNYTDMQSCPAVKYGQSGKSAALVCTTLPCQPDGNCTYSWGYWKTHGPTGCSPGNQSNEWDVQSLEIGGVTLDQAALCTILQDNPRACGKGTGANTVLILEHQLIAAMLNVANGAISCPTVNAAIAAASNLLTGNVNNCVGTQSVLGPQFVELAGILAAYNSDACVCPSEPAAPNATTNVKRTTWGQLKVIYR